MNKADLIEAVAIKCDISKLAAQRAVDAMIDTITNSLQNGKEVQLLGFGTFSVVERAARKGRNLRTNKSIEIPARKVPKSGRTHQKLSNEPRYRSPFIGDLTRGTF